jgi:hypothetical protein
MSITRSDWADLASVMTAAVAAVAFFGYHWGLARKRRQLEAYLKSEQERDPNPTKGQPDIVHLIAQLGLTQDEIPQASFRGKHILRIPARDQATHRAVDILFRYK